MVKVDLAANLKKAEEAGLLGGGTMWKPKEGDNRIRLVPECIEHPGPTTASRRSTGCASFSTG
jgi:hypothetical protein